MSHHNPETPSLQAEKNRLASLRSYHILDTLNEVEYDSITKIAAGICQVPVSLMTLMDEKRQWFKSRFGFAIQEIPREIAFCNHLISDPHRVLVVPDLRKDKRFAQNPLVAGDPNVVFYAGASLINAEGHVLGSICVYDRETHHLDEDQQAALAALAQQVMNSLELRKKLRELKITQQKLRKVNKNLKRFAHVISHDIKTPLAAIAMLTTAMEDSPDEALQENNRRILDLIHRNAHGLQDFIDQVLLESSRVAGASRRQCDPVEAINHVTRLLGSSAAVSVEVLGKLPRLHITKTALQQVLQNLITNAIKYNDKPEVRIRISSHSCAHYHHLSVADNGTGIAPEQLHKIFEEHKTLDQTDRFGAKGTGIGLSTVKRVLGAAGGAIRVASTLHEGSVFTISIPQHITGKEAKMTG